MPKFYCRSAQPGVELRFELATAARGDDPLAKLPVLHDADRREILDAELLREVRPFVDRHPHELERVVVAAALQHLRDEALDAPATPGLRGEEEDEPRSLARSRDRLGMWNARHDGTPRPRVARLGQNRIVAALRNGE